MIGLNLGCGSDILLPTAEISWINTDIVPLPGTHPHDLEDFPWPWHAGTFGRIRAKDVFEHISPRATVGFMVECHRLLAPRGMLELRVPHWQYENAWTDPTHQRACTEHTFDYWIAGTVLHERHNAAYGAVSFTLKDQGLDGYDLTFMLVKT